MVTQPKVFNISFLILLLTIFQSCLEKEDKFYATIQKEFFDSIKLSKAKEFKYQYDELTPQASYFVNSKMKFLTLKSSGEYIDIEQKIIFDSDTISVIYIKEEVYSPDSKREWRDWSKREDTVHIYDYKKQIASTYQSGKLIKRKAIVKSSKQEREFTYQIKNETEAQYNSR